MPVDGYVTTEGSTVQEAVQKALRALKITKDQAHIEVLSQGNRGFLGLGSHPARVKVCVKEEAAAEMELHDVLVQLDIKDEAGEHNYRPRIINKNFGVVEVKNGVISVKDPSNSGNYATLKPGKHVSLKVNGKTAAEETYVSEKDTIEIEFFREQPVSSFLLNLSDDQTEAYLRLVKRPGASYKLKDQEPANNLILLTEVEELLEPEPSTMDDLNSFLHENNIVRGVLEDAALQVLENPNSTEPYLIAQGQRPIDGKDAYIAYPFQENGTEVEEEELFGRTKIVSVKKGAVVAVKIPSEKGIDGWTVTGDAIKAKVPVECELTVKTGCELIDNGVTAVAVLAGRPVIGTSGTSVTVSVEPVYELKNVDHTTGDVRFSGDVEVRGDVKEGFTVEAEGNIEVFGDVTRATLKAGASVWVHKMVLGSTVVAGGLGALYTTITPLLKEIKDLIEKIYGVAVELKEASGFKTSDLQTKGDGQLIQLLIDTKFHSLSKLVNDLSQMVVHSEQPVNEEVAKVTNLLYKSLCGLGPLHLEKVEYLKILIRAVDQLIPLVSGYMAKEDTITARYVQNSNLHSSGDIIIEGQGCYISTVTSGGEVIITGSPGIARGVKITAKHNVTVKELGSEFDTQTSVTVKGNGKISAELVHPNVILQIGSERFRVDKSYRNLDAYINHEKRLVIDKLLAGEKPK